MKKEIKLLFSVACFSMLSLSACGGNTPPAHEHTWSGGWNSDATNHWHGCETCGAKKDEAAHEYDNDHDATCNVCGYERSLGDHVAESSWSHDNVHHWHACQHQGCELTFDYAEHSFDDDHDTTCECGYVRDIGDHAPKSTWSRNDTHHWHKCTHEGCELIFDYEEHQLNVVGGCIDCYASFETSFDITSKESIDINFGYLEAKTYYFWVCGLTIGVDYYLRFPWDQVVNCYYYASSDATELSLHTYTYTYVGDNQYMLPHACTNHTELFFNFTVEPEQTSHNFNSIRVYRG